MLEKVDVNTEECNQTHTYHPHKNQKTSMRTRVSESAEENRQYPTSYLFEKDCLHKTSLVQELRPRVDKWDLIKLINFYAAKGRAELKRSP